MAPPQNGNLRHVQPAPLRVRQTFRNTLHITARFFQRFLREDAGCLQAPARQGQALQPSNNGVIPGRTVREGEPFEYACCGTGIVKVPKGRGLDAIGLHNDSSLPKMQRDIGVPSSE